MKKDEYLLVIKDSWPDTCSWPAIDSSKLITKEWTFLTSHEMNCVVDEIESLMQQHQFVKNKLEIIGISEATENARVAMAHKKSWKRVHVRVIVFPGVFFAVLIRDRSRGSISARGFHALPDDLHSEHGRGSFIMHHAADLIAVYHVRYGIQKEFILGFVHMSAIPNPAVA